MRHWWWFCLLFATATASLRAQTYVYGGPGSLLGRFQDSQGNMDLQGWAQVYCDANDRYWQIDEFNAENLNAHGAGNHALWAGQSSLQQPSWNNAPGYGNSWWSVAEWTHGVDDPVSSVEVTLQFFYNHDTEVGYDHFLVEWFDGEDWHNLLRRDGTNQLADVFAAPGEFFDQTWTMQPADFSGAGNDLVRLRLVVQSDGAVSDEDSLPLAGGETDGAAQVDDIRVLFDGVEVDGGGDADGLATFEDGDDEGWTPRGAPCTCQLLEQLPTEFEPTLTNPTPLIGHVQHEAVQTATFCTFVSPTFDFSTPGSPDEATLQFDAFFDSDTRVGFSTYDVRAGWYVDGVWLPTTTVFTGEIPSNVWQTIQIDLTGIAPPEATLSFVTIALHAGDGVYHAMVYDNFTVYRGLLGTGSDDAPQRTSALHVFPNPSNPRAMISFELERAGRVRLVAYDARGRLVRELADTHREAGPQEFLFDGRNDAGAQLASGVYFLQLETPDGIRGRRLTLVR